MKKYIYILIFIWLINGCNWWDNPVDPDYDLGALEGELTISLTDDHLLLRWSIHPDAYQYRIDRRFPLNRDTEFEPIAVIGADFDEFCFYEDTEPGSLNTLYNYRVTGLCDENETDPLLNNWFPDIGEFTSTDSVTSIYLNWQHPYDFPGFYKLMNNDSTWIQIVENSTKEYNITDPELLDIPNIFNLCFQIVLDSDTLFISNPVQSAYTPLFSVSGTVEDINGLPINEAEIQCTVNGDDIYNYITGPSGVFQFNEIPYQADLILAATSQDYLIESDPVLIEQIEADIDSLVFLGIMLPEAGLTAEPDSIFVGQSVYYTDVSIPGSYPLTVWEWDFNGDGEIDITDNTPDNSHFYEFEISGEFNTTLKVIDEQGYFDISVTLIVVVSELPIAAFSATPESVFTDQPVLFTDESEPGSYPLATWEWDFDGDGVIDATGQGPHEYSYSISGNYLAGLTVFDTEGNLDSTSQTIEIIDFELPVANFSVDADTALVDQQVLFTDVSIPGSCPIILWEWDFNGDEIIDQTDQESSSHDYSFTVPGYYKSFLSITDSLNNIVTVSHEILIIDFIPPTASFTAEPNPASVNQTVTFTDTSMPGTFPIVSWIWDFDGDEQPDATGAGPHEFQYNESGRYNVSLVVQDEQGNTNQFFVIERIFE